MKVDVGRYKSFIGAYQIVDWFSFLPIHQRDLDTIGDWLSETWVQKFCLWVDSKRKRKIKIRIDPWDSWNADETMALIILPILKQLKATKHGAPHVDDEDVPKHLRRKSKINEWETDDLWFERFDWILDEVIWAFENVIDSSWEDQFHSGEYDYSFIECESGYELKKGKNHTAKFDKKGYDIYKNRIQNGLRLFGKYYLGFWD